MRFMYRHLAPVISSVLSLIPLGCGVHGLPKEYGSLNEAMLREPHSPLDEHATADVVEESGLRELIRKEGLLKDSNYIVGTVAFGASMKKRPEFNLEKYDTFRMALSIYTASGEAIPDFFEGLPGASLDNPIVGTGHHIKTLHDWCKTKVSAHSAFHEHFPCEDGREGPFQDITLTFKEFNHHCYYLKDVPAGTAYVWFQIPLDGNRATQAPIVVDLEPVEGAIRRHDLKIYLYDLFYSM